MASIDIHAHILPRQATALASGGEWHGYSLQTSDSGGGVLKRQGKEAQLIPKLIFTPEQRLADMDSLGVDVHVLSTWTRLYNYDLRARCMKSDGLAPNACDDGRTAVGSPVE